MPNIVPANRYYPKLSEIVTVDDLPEFLSFVQEGLNAIFDKIHYKNLQYSKSYRGDAAFYSLEIVSKERLAFTLPLDLVFVLNPDISGGDASISSFPITVEYQWEILGFLKSFNLQNFSFTLEDFYTLGLQVFRITEEQVLANIVNQFVINGNNGSSLQELITEINGFIIDEYPGVDPIVLPHPTIPTLVAAIKGIPGIDRSVGMLMFSMYVLDIDINQTKRNLQNFFNTIVPEDIESYIKKIITPKAKATLELIAGIEFPRSILKPVTILGEDLPGKSTFIFAQAELYADTESGIGYQVEMGGSLYPPLAEIGNTGILLQLESLKLDLSTKTNIAEADADGRPADFTGVYARAVSLTLPPKWFHESLEDQGSFVSTLRIGGYNLLIGTGGFSGTILIEAVPTVNESGAVTNYFDNFIRFNYPLTVLKNDPASGKSLEIKVENLTALKSALSPGTELQHGVAPFTFKFPISLEYNGEVKIFNNISSYQKFLQTVDEGNVLWKKIGDSNGFNIGFSSFDIIFDKGKVVSSNIVGKLQIAKFQYPEESTLHGRIVTITVEGHINDDGDFNLTASVEHPYPIVLSDVFSYDIKSAELGKEDGKYYIGTAGVLQFGGILEEIGVQPLVIDKLRIYSDGSFDFIGGGSIILQEPIRLPIGPVAITVTALHFGTHQKEYDGVMRKFGYFGFDGGISIDPLGIEVRGDGVKFYFCVDDVDGKPKPKPYLHIQTLYVDLTIPASTPVAIINGWLSIPEPGVSPEYEGGITIKLPKAHLSGSASMKLMPKYPAFIIDAEIEFPAPIPLGSFAIYGFRGLLGYRYVAEKEAAGLVSGVNTWYEYYKAPPLGIHVKKFNGPNRTKQSGTPFSIGAGASLGTSYDNGTTLNIKAMVLLSVPSLFMIDGRATIISARLGLDDTGDPPFFAFLAIGDNSIEFGFGADLKIPSGGGEIVSLYADIEAGFFFKNPSKWYINLGTKANPVTARIVTLITLKSYVMLSAKGIEAGARGEFIFSKSYGPVKVAAWAYVEVGGKISFERPQLGAFIAAGVGAEIDIKILHLFISIDLLFGGESPKPFLIYGKFRLCVKVKILFIKIKFCGEVEIAWDFDKRIRREPINPLVNEKNGSDAKIAEIVKGIHMLTNESFQLAYITEVNSEGVPMQNNIQILPDQIVRTIIPLDTYIDIKTEKGLLPGPLLASKIGGQNNGPGNYVDLIPPDSVVRGKTVRQVKHQYTIDDLSIKYWTGTQWADYNPYKALYPDDQSLNNLKIGQWQKMDDQYNTVRILATTPFSYTEQGEPGWFTPEEYGHTAGSLFCTEPLIQLRCANFLQMPLGRKYYCYDQNQAFLSNEVAFLLLNNADEQFAEVVALENFFEIPQSLSFENNNSLQIILPQPSVDVNLKLSSLSQAVKIQYYAALIDDLAYEVPFGHPDPQDNSGEPFEIIVLSTALHDEIRYRGVDHPGWKAISKIIVEPMFADENRINNLLEQIALADQNNLSILLTGGGAYIDTSPMQLEIATLRRQGCAEVSGTGCETDTLICNLYGEILEIFNKCFVKPNYYSTELPGVLACAESIIKKLDTFVPSYQLNIILYTYIKRIKYFTDTPSLESYAEAWYATSYILSYLNNMGNCDCITNVKQTCHTLLHEVCWLSLEDHEYNINIPSQAAIQADATSAIVAINKYVQPIWRPDTSYIIHFKLSDRVDNSLTGHAYNYTFGFSTGGPVGFFHTHQFATYGDLEIKPGTDGISGRVLEDTTGIVRDANGTVIPFTSGTLELVNGDNIVVDQAHPLTDHPDKYPLTSIRQYIDYDRSYPNANGNLLGAKPLFYDDDQYTKINLYFTKAYAMHFFQDWQELHPGSAIKGTLKIVIKDPNENVDIINPPSLDVVIEDIDIPQTVEEWTTDNNPLVPFALQQYLNLFQGENCIIDKPEVIKPAAMYRTITPKKLKASKLYTAIVNNVYDLNKDGQLGPLHDATTGITTQQAETKEVHKFVFQTSRYRNFREQVLSYLLSNEGDQSLRQPAIFKVDLDVRNDYLSAAYKTITGAEITELPDLERIALKNNYQHPFDLLTEGLLMMEPLNVSVTTEFNILCVAGEPFAILIKNPEPFNDPKIPVNLTALRRSIGVLSMGGASLDQSYKMLYSKDNSQAIIMTQDLLIVRGSYDIQFQYLVWDNEESRYKAGTVQVAKINF